VETRIACSVTKKKQRLLLHIQRELHRNFNSETTQTRSGRLCRQIYFLLSTEYCMLLREDGLVVIQTVIRSEGVNMQVAPRFNFKSFTKDILYLKAQ
jgi:hypothetical protein